MNLVEFRKAVTALYLVLPEAVADSFCPLAYTAIGEIEALRDIEHKLNEELILCKNDADVQKKEELHVDMLKEMWEALDVHPSWVDTITNEMRVLKETKTEHNTNYLETFYYVWKDFKVSGKKPGTKNNINSWLAFWLGMTVKEPVYNFLPSKGVFSKPGIPNINDWV